MADSEQKRLMELQMEALKEAHGLTDEESTDENRIPANARSANNAKIAALYEDAAEYEEELACFEAELQIVNENKLRDLPTLLVAKFPNEDRDYDQELNAVLEAGWTDTQVPLTFIKETAFTNVMATFHTTYPNYADDFETQVRDILIKRWEMLVSVKKEHVKEELAEMKLRGMKPDHIRKVYKNFHGIV